MSERGTPRLGILYQPVPAGQVTPLRGRLPSSVPSHFAAQGTIQIITIWKSLVHDKFFIFGLDKGTIINVAQLYNYASAVRKIMYTTNAIESVNSSFRKVTNKGAFPNENALLKLLFLRVKELQKKWNGRRVSNWALVRNQLEVNERIKQRIIKYDNQKL